MGKRKEVRRSYGTVPQRVLDLLRPGTQSMQLYNVDPANAYVTVRIVTGDNVARFFFTHGDTVIWECDFYPVGSDI